jgi:protocatechuate 3,4-dioxygenase beta subunit
MAMLISGIVTDSDGQSVAGARVLLSQSPVPVPDVAAVTDSEGRFALSAPTPGQYAVAAFADGHAPADLKLDIDGDVDVVLTLKRSADEASC